MGLVDKPFSNNRGLSCSLHFCCLSHVTGTWKLGTMLTLSYLEFGGGIDRVGLGVILLQSQGHIQKWYLGTLGTTPDSFSLWLVGWRVRTGNLWSLQRRASVKGMMSALSVICPGQHSLVSELLNLPLSRHPAVATCYSWACRP